MASYSKLKALRVAFLKIDGTFIRDLTTNPLDRAMVDSINQMAHVLGIRTVAEGVSGAALLQKLEALGVDYAQGFGVEEPRPIEELVVTGSSPAPRERSRPRAAGSRP
jgi:EAL domain-containing protein (putative c-di-GMP-specific phosphodiesterase class I)